MKLALSPVPGRWLIALKGFRKEFPQLAKYPFENLRWYVTQSGLSKPWLR